MKQNAVCLTQKFLMLLTVFGLSFHHAASAEEPIVKVEESWEIKIRAADAEIQAPQITTVMTPHSEEDGDYFVFNLNHATQPEFSDGSMQVHCWKSDELFAYNLPMNLGFLRQGTENVSWTQCLELRDGNLIYSVTEGASLTWGDFGGEESLRITMPSSLQNLDGYSTDDTVSASEVGFAGNRVDRLVLKSVKYYGAHGLVKQSTDALVVHESK